MKRSKLISLIVIAVLGFITAKHFRDQVNSKVEKILHTEVYRPVVSLDPQKVEDLTSVIEVSKAYEGLLEYAYLERPAKIVPNLAESMPEISDDGKKYTFKIKKGVFFQDNECFNNGKGKELKASDFIYTIKRLADPKNSAPLFSLIDGLIIGMDEWRENLTKGGSFDDNIAGLEIIDDYTFSITLLKEEPTFIYNFCMPHFYAIAKEAIDFYGDDIAITPVGTGPFIIKDYDPQLNQVIATKNPNYREKYYPSSASEGFKHLLNDSGKRLPLVDKIITYIIIEEQSRWLKFLNNELDILDLCNISDLGSKISGNEPVEELKSKGISLVKSNFSHTAFYNINHKEKLFQNIHLRKALSLAYDRKQEVNLFFSGLHSVAHGIIPNTMLGYDENYRSGLTDFNLEEAKKELALAGFPEGKDLPVITLDIRQGTLELQQAEYFKQCMSKIGVNINININSMPELINKCRQGNYQLAMMQWFADYPDASTFFSLFYSPISYAGVYTYYNNKTFDGLYEYILKCHKNREDITDLYKKMNEKIIDDVAVITRYHNASLIMLHKRVKNFAFLDCKFNCCENLNIE